MMDQGMLAGLFGATPEQLQAKQYQDDSAFADRYAQLSPLQQATAGFSRTGGMLGRALGNQMGMEDQQVTQARQAQSLQSQIDHSSAEGLLKGAQIFNAAGNPRMAAMYMQAAQARKMQEEKSFFDRRKDERDQLKTERDAVWRHEEKLAEIAQRAEAARQRSEDMRLSLADRQAARAEMVSLRRDLASNKTTAQGPQKLSPTAQKELFESDDVVNSAQNVISTLESVITKDPKTGKSQNDLAYQGGGAELLTNVMGYIPGNYPAENASVDLKNKVTGQALEQLKAVFGGMPTEGERKVLLELQGSLNLKASQREAIYKRAIALAQRRLEQAKDKANRLRSGTYFGPQETETAISPEDSMTIAKPQGWSVQQKGK